MTLRPGSFAWLAAHDLRQSWRGFEAALGGFSRIKVALLILFVLAVHVAFWWALRLSGGDDASSGAGAVSPYVAIGALFVLPGIIAQAMTSATRALYARGDFDLLFASPVSPRAVFAARAVAIAANAIAWFAILLLPLANVNALAGRPRWLALYPTLVACGLFGAALGIVAALALFAAVGPRRARLVSQIAATLIGASFMLGLQGYALATGAARGALLDAMKTPGPGLPDWQAFLSLPARAAVGDMAALGEWIGVALIAFVAVTVLFGERFAKAAMLSAGAPSATSRPRRRRAFRGALGATLRSKERRVVWRDPWLMSQILLQLIYMLPISVILWRNGGVTGAPAVVFTPLIVVIGAQLSGSLAWLALSGEDAPDLLRAAPVSPGQIERHKIQAVLTPVALVLLVPTAALIVVSPLGGVWAGLFAFAASVSTALVNLWRQSPARRSMVLRRHSQSKIVALVEHLLSIVWAVAAVMAVMGSWGALVPAGLACAILWASRPRAARVSLPASA